MNRDFYAKKHKFYTLRTVSSHFPITLFIFYARTRVRTKVKKRGNFVVEGVAREFGAHSEAVSCLSDAVRDQILAKN